MGYDLSGKGGYFRWAGAGWSSLLDLGEAYGWEPLGTRSPRRTPADAWDGGYFSNDGQLFTARDAKGLAQALEKALADFPTYQWPAGSDRNEWLATAEGRAAIEQFVAFLRAGSFRLY